MKKEIKFPCMNPILVPIEKVVPNEWNPNKMEAKMTRLLKTSVEEDGLTMPVVAWHDSERDVYVIVDGENRWKMLKKLKSDVCPVSLTSGVTQEDRMISTIRHNITKGTHQLKLVHLIFQTLIKVMKLSEIQRRLELVPEQLVAYVKGGSIKDEFGNKDYSNSWERNPEDRVLYSNPKTDEYGDDN